jgi:predicted nucleic acid-binding protein
MSGKAFFDTNVLVYAFTPGAKGSIAEKSLADGGLISVQVLNEFANVSRRKLELSWKDIDARIGVVLALCEQPVPITLQRHSEARAIAARRQLAFYDALIIASAVAAGARELLSEDMQDGSRFGDLRVRNPFVS